MLQLKKKKKVAPFIVQHEMNFKTGCWPIHECSIIIKNLGRKTKSGGRGGEKMAKQSERTFNFFV